MRRTASACLVVIAGLLVDAPAAQAAGCAAAPELCGLPVTSLIEQPDLSRAVDVVLVGDGFTDLDTWHDTADEMIAALKWQLATGVYGSVEEVWNLHVVDLLSPEGASVTDPETTDTPLGMVSTGSQLVTAKSDRAALAATNAPDVDVVVAIANSSGGRANASFPPTLASGGTIRLSRAAGPFAHELGHAAFWLADEYSESSACQPKSDGQLVRQRNTTADPTCAKFSTTDGAGCVEGSSYCAEGIFRPSQHCFMRSSGNVPACPVCRRTIRDTLLEVRSGVDQAEPWAALLMPEAGAVLSGWVTLATSFHDDFFAPVTVAVEVDGALVDLVEAWESPVWTGLDTRGLPDGQHEVLIHVSDAAGRSRTAPAVLVQTANASGGEEVDVEVVVTKPAPGESLGGLQTVVWGIGGADEDEGAATFGPPQYAALLADGVPVAAAPGGWKVMPWDTAATAPGPVALTVVAVDGARRVATSAPLEVTVIPSAGEELEEAAEPAFLLPEAPWATAGARLPVGWSGACTLSVDGGPVELEAPPLEGSEVTLALVDASGWALGPHLLELVCAGGGGATLPVIRANGGGSLSGAVLVAPGGDLETWVPAPVELLVAATAPAAAVESVGIVVDGTLEALAPGSQATFSWVGEAGCHALAPVAIGADGAWAGGAARAVCVDGTPPTAEIVLPVPGEIVAPELTVVVASVSDEVGTITRVELMVDGDVVTGVDAAAPTTFLPGAALATTLTAGPHLLAVRARDEAGNWTTSAAVEVLAEGCEVDSACDDGDACTTDRCAATGVCWAQPIGACCETGSAAETCDDKDPCTTDVCTPVGCKHVTLEPGCCNHPADCPDEDGDPCTAAGCTGPGGACYVTALPCCEADADCDDGDPCTVDACLDEAPGGVCAHAQAPGCCATDTACDDGDPCTTNACVGGGCVSSPVPGACCAVDGDCGAGLLCSAEVCVASQCVTVPKTGDGSACCAVDADCPTAAPCEVGWCTGTGVCRFDPVPGCCTFDSECDDEDPCSEDVCGAGQTCEHAIACCTHDHACEDDDPCTQDLCVEGSCTHPQVGGPGCCDQDLDCDDWNACTLDVCEEGTCGHAPVAGCCGGDAECEDGDPCTTDRCVGGACTHDVLTQGCCTTDADCDNGDPCATWACVGAGCVAELETGCCHLDAECGDADPCTVDRCEGLACVHEGIEGCCLDHVACEDDDPCTVTACVDHVCVAVAFPGCCDEDVDCATTTPCHISACVEGGCVLTLAPGCCEAHGDCDDGDGCTFDGCVDGQCQHVALPGCVAGG